MFQFVMSDQAIKNQIKQIHSKVSVFGELFAHGGAIGHCCLEGRNNFDSGKLKRCKEFDEVGLDYNLNEDSICDGVGVITMHPNSVVSAASPESLLFFKSQPKELDLVA